MKATGCADNTGLSSPPNTAARVVTRMRARKGGAMRLQDLIWERKKNLNVTWDELVERTEAAGYPVKRSMWHHWARGAWTNIPPTEAIRGIAAALEVEEDEVLNAAAESVGLTPRELHLGRGRRAVLALLADRTPEEIAALEQVVRSVTRAMDLQEDSKEVNGE